MKSLPDRSNAYKSVNGFVSSFNICVPFKTWNVDTITQAPRQSDVKHIKGKMKVPEV